MTHSLRLALIAAIAAVALVAQLAVGSRLIRFTDLVYVGYHACATHHGCEATVADEWTASAAPWGGLR